MQSSHDVLRQNILSNWFATSSLQRWMHWVKNSIKLPSSGKIQTWFTRTLAIWIPSSTLQYLLCNSYGWMWSSANSFLSVLWWRGVSICYRPTGEFWINSTTWDFHSLYRLWRKFKRKLGFLFVGKGKLFIMKLFFEVFNLICFTVERLTCFEMQPRQRRFCWILHEVHFLLDGQGNYSFKRKFMYL